MRSLSREQYEVVASFEEDLRTPEEGVTEQLQAAEFAALSLAQKTAEKMTRAASEGSEADPAALDSAAEMPEYDAEVLSEFAALSLAQKQAKKMTGGGSEGNEADPAALDIAAGAETASEGSEADPAALDTAADAPVYGAEGLSEGNLPSGGDSVEADLVAAMGDGAEVLTEGNLPSGVDSVKAELVEEAIAEGQANAEIAEPPSSGIVEGFDAANLEAAAAEEAAEGALEDLEGTETEDAEQAAAAPAIMDFPAEVRIVNVMYIIYMQYICIAHKLLPQLQHTAPALQRLAGGEPKDIMHLPAEVRILYVYM